jgi:glutathione S-transferase
VRSIAGMLALDTHPFITPQVKKYLSSVGGFNDAAWRAWQTYWLSTGLSAVEARLASEADTGTFCHGEQPTSADICRASLWAVMRVLKITVTNTPTLDRIMVACDAHVAFACAAPQLQAGAPGLSIVQRG